MYAVLILLGLAVPRAAILILWLLTDWFDAVFATWIWPLLGFLFLPTTLIWYSVVQNWFGGEWGLLQIGGVVVALLIDTSPGHAGRR